MLHGLVTDAKLPKIESHHLGLNLYLIVLLAGIDPNHRPNHLRHNDHISQVRLHQVGLLVRLCVLFGAAEFLDEAHGFSLEAAVEAAASAGMDDITELFGGEVEEPARSVKKGLMEGDVMIL